MECCDFMQVDIKRVTQYERTFYFDQYFAGVAFVNEQQMYLAVK